MALRHTGRKKGGEEEERKHTREGDREEGPGEIEGREGGGRGRE